MEGVVEQNKSFCDQSVSSIKASVSETMAEFSLLYFPPPPRPRTSLPIVSDVDVHPSRLAAAFRQFMGDPDAQWSCPQQAVFVEYLVGGRDNVLGILGTGFGKTTIIMFIAKTYSQGKSTVVVMPLAALHEDFHNRARSYGLKATQWSPTREFESTAHIITAAVDNLEDERFLW
jgi:superfamily II DNA helicase RecQ